MLEQLKKQKVAYQILYHALKDKKLAHAYLFCGEAGTPKKEAAYFLVQSLVCEKGEIFACETCDTCQRVAHDGFADLIYVDGKTKSIKKSDIMDIQERFSKTRLESIGKKVYILDGVENATKEALNSLLKFLEEPESDTLAILLCEHSDRLLETIVSRCQLIPFYKQEKQSLQEELRVDMDALEAYIISGMCANQAQGKEVFETDEFQHAFYLFNEFIARYQNRKASAKVFLQNEGFKKSKRDDKKVFAYFLDMMILLCRDCYRKDASEIISIWGKSGEIMLQWDRSKYFPILIETKDSITRSVNIPLLLDQMLYRWEE